METLNLGIDGLDDIEQIGAGGSSRVYRAKQEELDRLVALKVLKASDDPDVARRFDRERKAMGRLSLNEGIVPVYSSGMTDNDEPYLIMPYYPNGSLQDRIEAGPVQWNEAVAYISSAARTMAAAHEADVVHLDLKPANILLTTTGEPRIADFGIAKLMGDQTASNSTGPSFTPTFSAPETLLGGQASQASDVYGLAATLWALIAGRPPFRAINGEDNTLMAVVGRVVHQPADDLRHVAPDPICSVIEIAMAKDPSDRYPTAGAFRQALESAVDQAGTAGSEHPTIAGAPVDLAGSHLPGQAGTAGSEPTVASSAASMGDAGSSLHFDAPVPPRLVPAGNARSAGIADAFDRYSGVLVGLTVAALLVAAVFLGQRLLDSSDDTATDGTTQLVQADQTTPSTEVNAQAGAGGDDAEVTARPTTSATTVPTSATSIVATTAATTASTSEASTTTVESTTSSESSTTTEESTTTTEESTTTSDTTTSSSSSSSSSTSSSTIPVPQLDPPTGLAGSYDDGEIVITWTPPADTTGLAGYTVYRDGDPIASIGPGRRQYRDDELPVVAPDTVYVYQLRAEGPPSGDPASSALSGQAQVVIPKGENGGGGGAPGPTGP